MVKKETTKATARKTKRTQPAPAPAAETLQRATAARAPRLQVTHEMIAKRAYEIWCGRGRPHGTDVQNWVEAEQQLFGSDEAAQSDA